MKQPTSTADYRKYPKGPNFLLIVILSGAATFIVLLGAVLLLNASGKRALPKLHPDPHPTSSILLPASTKHQA
jgi:hypothetical protein